MFDIRMSDQYRDLMQDEMKLDEAREENNSSLIKTLAAKVCRETDELKKAIETGSLTFFQISIMRFAF